MARGGARRNKPTALRVIEGNPGKRPLNDDEPQPDVLEDLKPPLGLDVYGKQAWKRNAVALQRLGLLTESDQDQLAAYCMAYSRWRKANKAIANVDPISEAYRGLAVTIEKAEQAMRLFAGEFGMTPKSRSQLKVETREKSDPFDDWMSGDRRSS